MSQLEPRLSFNCYNFSPRQSFGADVLLHVHIPYMKLTFKDSPVVEIAACKVFPNEKEKSNECFLFVNLLCN